MKARGIGWLGLLLLIAFFPLPSSEARAQASWPPIRVHLDSAFEEANITFLVTLENLTDQPIYGLTVMGVIPEGTRYLDSWAGSPYQNPGVFDGRAVGWIHEELPPRAQRGPFAYMVSYELSFLPSFATYTWVAWTGPAAGSVTSEVLSVTPVPKRLVETLVVHGFWLAGMVAGMGGGPKTRFTDEDAGIPYTFEAEGVQPGDAIEFKVYDQATGELVRSQLQRLSGAGGVQGGAGVSILPPGTYRAQLYANGKLYPETIVFEVVPYTGPPQTCQGIGFVEVTLVLAREEEVSRAIIGVGATRIERLWGTDDSIRLRFWAQPWFPSYHKALEETNKIIVAIKEELASLGIPREQLFSLQTAPFCVAVGSPLYAALPPEAHTGGDR